MAESPMDFSAITDKIEKIEKDRVENAALAKRLEIFLGSLQPPSKGAAVAKQGVALVAALAVGAGAGWVAKPAEKVEVPVVVPMQTPAAQASKQPAYEAVIELDSGKKVTVPAKEIKND